MILPGIIRRPLAAATLATSVLVSGSGCGGCGTNPPLTSQQQVKGLHIKEAPKNPQEDEIPTKISLNFDKGMPDAKAIKDLIDKALILVLADDSLKPTVNEKDIDIFVVNDFNDSERIKELANVKDFELKKFLGNAVTLTEISTTEDGKQDLRRHLVFLRMPALSSLENAVVTIDHELGHIQFRNANFDKASGTYRQKPADQEEREVFRASYNRLSALASDLDSKGDKELSKIAREIRRLIEMQKPSK